jgi:hypothetical protein
VLPVPGDFGELAQRAPIFLLFKLFADVDALF